MYRIKGCVNKCNQTTALFGREIAPTKNTPGLGCLEGHRGGSDQTPRLQAASVNWGPELVTLPSYMLALGFP